MKTRAGRQRRLRFEEMERRELLTTLPAGFVETSVASGLNRPTAMDFAPDGRLFITQQGGALRVVDGGQLVAAPVLSLNVDSAGERGLLGIAFDPNFASNSFLYVYYTVPGTPAHNRVSRFTLHGDVADPSSEVPILDLDPLSLTATNHNGGAIHFGADGALYVGVGDNANGANAQSLNTRLGKILRIHSDGSIPADNPFATTASGANRAIWALGLRNPFTFAVQPGTGQLFINDVGQNTWEEIDVGRAGANYGWPATEGPTNDPRFQGPLYAYQHGTDNVDAITGGTFYDPTAPTFPAEDVDKYFFMDLGGRFIRRLDPATATVTSFATDLPALPVDLKVGPDGSLYYLARSFDPLGGVVNAISPVSPPTQGTGPVFLSNPADQVAVAGAAVHFAVQVAGDSSISIRWQRNGVDIPGATGPLLTLNPPTSADIGAQFRAVATGANGSSVSAEATLVADSPLVRALYQTILGRFATPSEIASGSARLASAAGAQGFVTSLLLSPERSLNALTADTLRLLNRLPTPAERFAALGQTGEAARLRRLAVLLGSDENFARSGGSNSGFVQSVYREALGRAASRREQLLARVGRTAATRTRFASRLLNSPVARTHQVNALYVDLLGRLPNRVERRTALARLRSTGSTDTTAALLLASPAFRTARGIG